jgi:hypothetical protein
LMFPRNKQTSHTIQLRTLMIPSKDQIDIFWQGPRNSPNIRNDPGKNHSQYYKWWRFFQFFLLLMYLIFNIQMYRWKAIKDKEAAAALRAMGRSERKLGLQLFDR